MSLQTVTLPLTNRKRTNRRKATNPLTVRKSTPRRIVLSVSRPTAVGPASEHERWVERVEARRRGGVPLHRPLLKESTVTLQVVTVPRRQGTNAISDELVREIHEAAMKGVLQPREAIVVTDEARDTENSARNRARAVADRYHEDYAKVPDPKWIGEGDPPLITNTVKFTAHAVPEAGPDGKPTGKFVGAISLRKPETPAPATTSSGAPAPAAKPPEDRTPPAKK